MSEAAGDRRPVRVLHVLPDLALGGGQQVLLRLLADGDPGRVRAHVAWFGPPDDLAGPLAATGAVLHDLGRWSVVAAPSLARRLAGLVRDHDIDVVHTHGTPVDRLNGLLAAWRTGRPVVTTLHGMRARPGPLSLRPDRLLRRATRTLSRRLQRALDRRVLARAIAVSDAVAADWAPALAAAGLPPASLAVVHSGVPVDAFAHEDPAAVAALRAELSLPDGARVLLALARLHPGKNLELLPEVLAELRPRLPQAHLVLVGEGPARGALEQAFARRGLSPAVRFAGRRHDVASALHLAEALVFPSLREGFGLVVLEALAAARPVVCLPLPSLARLGDAGGGLVHAAAPTGAAFASALAGLLADPSEARRRGRAGQAVVRAGWDSRAAAAAYAATYEEVVTPRLERQPAAG